MKEQKQKTERKSKAQEVTGVTDKEIEEVFALLDGNISDDDEEDPDNIFTEAGCKAYFAEQGREMPPDFVSFWKHGKIIHEKIYLIDLWTAWNDTIDAAIADFFKTFRYYPNILQANRHTFSQFDFLVNEMPDQRQKVSKTDDITGEKHSPASDEKISLGSFSNSVTDVDFYEDNQLPDKEFRLIYDDEPD
jgi:hypothetical protein